MLPTGHTGVDRSLDPHGHRPGVELLTGQPVPHERNLGVESGVSRTCLTRARGHNNNLCV